MDKIVLGISGGVDSAVAATLLLNKGYDVIPVFCIMHENYEPSLSDAAEVCEKLSLKLNIIDVRTYFSELVVKNFVSEYLNGRTPNPCIICNPNVKFMALQKFADENNIFKIATGHYADVGFENNRYFIKKTDSNKDQSYMLCRLTQDILKRVYFPLSSLSKDKIRTMAIEENLSVADKKDSQEICFTDDYKSFIESITENKYIGNFVLENGDVLGKHNGIYRYTVGQRKGLAISYKTPLYIKKIDPASNEIILSDKDVVGFTHLKCKEPVFQNYNGEKCFEGFVKIRYSSKFAKAKIEINNNEIDIYFIEPQRAITPGQSAVVYIDDGIVCSGFIIDNN